MLASTMITTNTALHTTLNLPCIAHEYYSIHCSDDLIPTMNKLTAKHTAFKILGDGSNVLCASKHLDAVLQMNIKGIQLLSTEPDGFIVQVGAGENWHEVVLYTLAHGWLGLENLALIPGSTGAAPVQNIGAYGVELSDRLHSVQAWDIEHKKMINIMAKDCGFAYRDSIFKQTHRYVITHITLKLPRPWQAVTHYGELAKQDWTCYQSAQAHAVAIAHLVIEVRQRKLPDPTQIPNAGSFFKNPIVSKEHVDALRLQYPNMPCYLNTMHTYKLAAGWLIETAGWKGHCRTTASGGRVGVHHAQALVLVHFGGATGDELLQLASDIQASVFNQFGLLLEREVNVW